VPAEHILGSWCSDARQVRHAPAGRSSMTRARRVTWLLLFLLIHGGVESTAGTAERLSPYGVDLSQTSVSGISSGGYMAVQFHVVHSSIVTGAGMLAAGPYYCAEGSVWTAYYNCSTPDTATPLPDLARLHGITDQLAAAAQIDPTDNLAQARVWLFTGKHDRTVRPAVVESLRRYYRHYVDPARIAYVDGIEAGHAMVTSDFGAACATSSPPYINDCDYDAARALLEHIYGPLDEPAAGAGQLIEFDQREFAGGDAYAIGMGDTGFAYVPEACKIERCRVHVAFHGCRQSAEAIGQTFARHAGYNRVADSKRLIVLYPQTIARWGWGFRTRWNFLFNPRGCWDWWGFTGPSYHTREGSQIKTVRGMLERLGQPRD
jgi:poly(3-hydroxybutyrate) depolymerase